MDFMSRSTLYHRYFRIVSRIKFSTERYLAIGKLHDASKNAHLVRAPGSSTIHDNFTTTWTLLHIMHVYRPKR
jgi:hypothetical protein